MQKVIFRKIGVKTYKPGRSFLSNKKKVIKLSANESALGYSSRVKKKLSKISLLSKYPDSKSKSIRKEISKKLKIDENLAKDGFIGVAPVDEYAPNAFGVYNAVGNVWEWCAGGTPDKRPLRGGSFVDTVDGKHNHALRCATRMDQTADSGGHNTGFRCARDVSEEGEL